MTTVNGLPVHVLLVHFIVVLAPLTPVLAILCAVWPAAGQRLVWLIATNSRSVIWAAANTTRTLRRSPRSSRRLTSGSGIVANGVPVIWWVSTAERLASTIGLSRERVADTMKAAVTAKRNVRASSSRA